MHNASSYQARADALCGAAEGKWLSIYLFPHLFYIHVGCERASERAPQGWDRETKCIRRIELKKGHRRDANVCNKIFMCHSHLHISLAIFFCQLKFIPVLQHVCTHSGAHATSIALHSDAYIHVQKFVHTADIVLALNLISWGYWSNMSMPSKCYFHWMRLEFSSNPSNTQLNLEYIQF